MDQLLIERIIWIAIVLLGYSGFISLLIRDRRLKNLLTLDPLTGVKNRRGFEENLSQLLGLSKRYHHSLALLMMDLDKFKDFNDTYGHPAGDKLLKEFARIAENNLRESDVLARYGGEEFAALLPETTQPEAMKVAERLRQTVDAALNTSVSIGVALYPEDAKDAGELVDRADKALYEAKETRNTVSVFKEE